MQRDMLSLARLGGRPTPGRVLFMLLLLGLLAGAGTAYALIHLEAEDFHLHHDGGGSFINRVSCSGASNNWAVDGVDVAGDWIQLEFILPDGGTYSDSLRSAGLEHQVRRLQLLVFTEDPEEPEFADTLVTGLGNGIG